MKTQSFSTLLHTVWICLFLFSSPVFSQKHAPITLERTRTTDNISGEEILKLGYKNNLQEIIKFAQGTHHIDSREIIYTYNNNSDLGKTTEDIYYDVNNIPSYLKAVTTNKSGAPVAGKEQVYSGKTLMQGYRWSDFKGKESAELYDINTQSYKAYQYTTGTMFHYTRPSVSDIYKDLNKTAWNATIQNMIAKGNSEETSPNDIFGGNENTKYERSNNLNMGIEVVEKKFYDAKGTLREYIYREYYPDDEEYEEITYYDCHGTPIYFESTYYDDDGCELECIDVAYKDGKPAAYWRDVDDWDADFREFYNPETDEFEYVTPDNEEYANYYWNMGMEHADEPCDDFPYNDVFIGPSLISEDSYQRFNTIGVEVSYTRYLCPHFGLTVDGGMTFGSQNSVDYTKTLLLGGVTYVPFKNTGLNNKFTLYLQAFAGIASIKSEYSQIKNTSTNLSAEFDVKGSYNISKHWGIAGGAGWNPVIANGDFSKDYRIFAGIRLDF